MDTVIAVDYSGTLSLAMAAFGVERSLTQALSASGLADLGVTVDRYWRDGVGSTWAEAAIGKSDAVTALSRQIADMPWVLGAESTVRRAVEILIAAYLKSATVHPAWAPMFFQGIRRGWTMIVATDHYVEATSAILGHLDQVGLPAQRIDNRNPADRIQVANSADLGHTKRSDGFWRAVDRSLGPAAYRRLILVDDFRIHEPTRAPWARAAAQARCAATRAAAKSVFDTVDVVFFETDMNTPEQWPEAIDNVWCRLQTVVDSLDSSGGWSKPR